MGGVTVFGWSSKDKDFRGKGDEEKWGNKGC